MNFYKRHLGDISKACAHLSQGQMGAYDLLLDWLYGNEKPLPLSSDALYRIARATTKAEKANTDAVISEFFDRTDEGYTQKRAGGEIAKYKERAETNRKIAEQREATKRARIVHESWSIREPSQNPESRIQNPDATATVGGNHHQATVVPIKPDQQLGEASDLATLGEANFARLVAEHHASAFGLSRAVPVGMQLGSLVTLRANSYAPAQSGDWWLNYFEHCAADDFLNGTKNPKFKADLVYLLDEKTFGRVIESSQKEAAHG